MDENNLSEPMVNATSLNLNLSDVLPIYQIICDDNRIYNNIVWQFPTALIAANGLLLQALERSPSFILLIISILNFGLIHALFKLGHNQQAIIAALQRTEKYITEIQNNRYKDFLPDFKKGQPKLLNISSRKLINSMLLIANSLYFVVELTRTILVIFPR
jgi:hypothetical protein